MHLEKWFYKSRNVGAVSTNLSRAPAWGAATHVVLFLSVVGSYGYIAEKVGTPIAETILGTMYLYFFASVPAAIAIHSSEPHQKYSWLTFPFPLWPITYTIQKLIENKARRKVIDKIYLGGGTSQELRLVKMMRYYLEDTHNEHIQSISKEIGKTNSHLLKLNQMGERLRNEDLYEHLKTKLESQVLALNTQLQRVRDSKNDLIGAVDQYEREVDANLQAVQFIKALEHSKMVDAFLEEKEAEISVLLTKVKLLKDSPMELYDDTRAMIDSLPEIGEIMVGVR